MTETFLTPSLKGQKFNWERGRERAGVGVFVLQLIENVQAK